MILKKRSLKSRSFEILVRCRIAYLGICLPKKNLGVINKPNRGNKLIINSKPVNPVSLLDLE